MKTSVERIAVANLDGAPGFEPVRGGESVGGVARDLDATGGSDAIGVFRRMQRRELGQLWNAASSLVSRLEADRGDRPGAGGIERHCEFEHPRVVLLEHEAVGFVL